MILTICPNPSIDKLLYIDELIFGGVNRSSAEKAFPGGKGVHVALALNELQTPAALIGFWGGPTGAWIKQECLKKNIAVFGPEVKNWTRTCLTILTRNEKKRNTEILENGPGITRENLQAFWEAINRQVAASSAVCVSGSWPAKTPETVYQTIKTICDEHQKDLWVDASGHWLMEALQAKPFGIHMNMQEARQAFGGSFQPEEYARKLLDFCSIAALTNGKDGLYLAYQSQIVHATCRVEQVISTVGSGDCLTAGLIHEWYKSKNMFDAAISGVACGAANCINPDLGMLRLADVQNFKKTAKTTIINKNKDGK